MKKKYSIYLIENTIFCVPSTDFYARGNDWQTEEKNILSFIESFDTLEEAETYLEKLIVSNKYEYTILLTYSKK